MNANGPEKRLFFYVPVVTMGLLVVAFLHLVFLGGLDDEWERTRFMGIVMASALIWLPFLYRHRSDNRPLLALPASGQKTPWHPPPRGAGFIWILIGSSVMSVIGLAILLWHPIGDYRRRIHASEAMAAIGAKPDEQYFKALVDSYRDVSPDVERTFGLTWLSTNDLHLAVERTPDGLYVLHLLGDGEDTIKCRTTGRISGDAPPNPHNNLGACADEESSRLMTLVLELASSRADHVDQILYTARTSWKQSGRVFEASVRPADYAAHKSEYANAGDFIKAKKSVLRDSFSDLKCNLAD